MSEDNKRLGKNPLSSLTSEEEESAKILRNNLISYKAGKRCLHLRYSKSYGQHYCVNPRSRQGELLGEEWKEKCRQCHMKITDGKKLEQDTKKKNTPKYS